MTNSITDGERKVLALAWHCFESLPKVDYNKLMELGGYKNKASATTAYHNARKKLLAVGAESAPKATGQKRKVPAAPKGAAKKRGRKAQAELAASGQEDDSDETEANGDEVQIKAEDHDQRSDESGEPAADDEGEESDLGKTATSTKAHLQGVEDEEEL